MRVFLLLMLFWAPNEVKAHSRGAPDVACANLTPRHGPPAQSALPPFTITPLKTVMKSGDSLEIQLNSQPGNSFKGFMLQAYDVTSNQPIGKFISSSTAKVVTCVGGTNNTLTHNGGQSKERIQVTWLAPIDYNGDVTFRATLVKDYSTFWVQVPSDKKVRVERSLISENPSTTVQPINVYNGCGQTKNCFGLPDNCQTTQNCDALVTFIGKGSLFEFEIFGKPLSAGNSYIAVGFSKDNSMGQDSVNECVLYNNQVNVHTSFNQDGYNERLNEPNLIIVSEARYVDGNLYCKFTRQASYSYDEVIFDLSQPHYLLLAKGPAEQSSISYHEARIASSDVFNLGTVGTSTPSTGSTTTVIPSTTRTSTTTSPGQSTPTGQVPSVYQGCGTTKNCFGIPTRCEQSSSCSSLVTFTKNGVEFVFELFGKATGPSHYIAVGFSKDDKMGQDSVNECVLLGNRVNVYTSQNYDQPRKSNTRITENVASLRDSSYENGNIYCKFTRRPVFDNENITYNLNEPTYLLLAAGSANPSSVGYHQERSATSAALDLGSFGEIAASNDVLIQVHGALMICAWILSASIGILLARYFRQTWVGKQIGGKDLWFVFHRIIMVTAWALTIIGFIVIFVKVKGWTESATENPHAIIGCITTGLAFIQPFMAYFRPHPGTPRRPIFNWAHWAVGNSAHILSIACIFLAVDLSAAGLPDWMRWVLVAYVVFYIAVHLILTISQCQNSKESRRNSSVFPMKELNSNTRGVPMETKKEDAPGSTLRKSLLGVYIIVIIGFSAALIAAVVRAPW